MRQPTRHMKTAGALALLVAASTLAVPAMAAEPVLLSQGKDVEVSSTENADYTPARAAVDGDLGTRWASEFSDDQSITVDLGAVHSIQRVDLVWEGAYGKKFDIQVSDDGTSWTTAKSVTDGTGGEQSVAVDTSGRFVRVQGVERGTGYGYSLWELQVFGDGDATDPDPDPEPTDEPTTGPGECTDDNAALGGDAASSAIEGDYAAARAFDGNTDTRWSSTPADDAYVQVDLGSVQDICGVDLLWEGAYGKEYKIQVSDDGSSWTTATTVTDGKVGARSIDLDTSGRYVRMQGVERGTGYGYSLWEFAVQTGTGGSDPTPTPTPTTTAGPIQGGGDLADYDNVYVFDESTPTDEIQSILDDAYEIQESNQFGQERYQFLFKPGTYDVNANIGFYESINGLGQNPDDVLINGGVWADANWFGGNATQNFWRSAENLSIEPLGDENRWAVSQAAPFRRMHVKGNLAVHSSQYGWASGGFIADSKIDGQVRAWTQQQWYTRDSSVGNWAGTLWNMTFSGVNNAPPTTYPDPAVTTLENTGQVREKPYIYWDGDDYAVFVPSIHDGTKGASWENGDTPGESISIDDFYIASPGDSAATMNAALAQGLNLLLTPGIYKTSETINVDNPDTVVLGLGYATIIPENGQIGMQVGDASGVKIAGVLFDAGPNESPTMLTVGTKGSNADHSSDPISIHDIFVRVGGGALLGKVETAIEINADDTIIDHIWSWRADHGDHVGWDVNTSDYGLIVNGDDVKGYGLFVEHYQKYNTLWNGNGGRTVFYQNELPYDPPTQEAFNHDGIRGWAAYKVADDVTTHEAWGLGSYCVFLNDDEEGKPAIVVDNGFEVPEVPGVKLHSLLTVSLGGQGTYEHVINGVGPSAQGTDTIPATVTTFGG
ncbi:hypothetical protein GCM10025865_06530 [Paraoerskovia sediminicola]|uniref:F5/8 type C domain-containing protein n=1 Tax=Paraoerskovia sediminicola TaxID=1138587 RepID=A0ABM8G012_9CELL|nr:discoidin domain-containing protein [Paraoerskovia sediminicola]BDZ41354.1 hypothetical protein GCM10025865_06530 [Paraoerskovia sediminicola]